MSLEITNIWEFLLKFIYLMKILQHLYKLHDKFIDATLCKTIGDHIEGLRIQHDGIHEVAKMYLLTLNYT